MNLYLLVYKNNANIKIGVCAILFLVRVRDNKVFGMIFEKKPKKRGLENHREKPQQTTATESSSKL